jgi:hypothetical protein
LGIFGNARFHVMEPKTDMYTYNYNV